MKIKMIIEPTKTGYSAYAEKFAICTTGNDLISLRLNMLEAINLYFDDVITPYTESDLDIVFFK